MSATEIEISPNKFPGLECQYNPDWWYPEKTGPRTSPYNQETARFAILLCGICPVKDWCREQCDKFETEQGGGLDYHYCHGIWAGETPVQRIARRRKEQRRKFKSHADKSWFEIVRDRE